MITFVKSKVIFLLLACSLLSLAAGVLFMLYRDCGKTGKLTTICLNNYLSVEEEEALVRFKNSSPSIGIYAQDRLIAYATYLKELGVTNEAEHSRIVGIAIARKALLYEIIGENGKSSESFHRAVEQLGKGNVQTNIQELRSVLEKQRTSQGRK